MQVLYFHQHFSTPDGATGTRSYEMARHLINQGHQVTMVCGSYNVGQTGLTDDFVKGRRTGMVDGIQVIEFDLAYANQDSLISRTWQFLKFAMRSVTVALKADYDLIFATSTPLTAAIPGLAGKWLRRKKFVFEVRDLWPELPKAMGVITNPVILTLMSWLEYMAYRSADACIGLSPGIVEGIKKRSAKDQTVAMVPNGCDLELFGRETEPYDFGLGANKFVACFTGAHGMANGLTNVLDAAEVLKQRGDERIVLLFIGEGKVKQALKEQAAQRQLDNCVFRNAIPKHELVQVLQHADAGLMTLANVPAFYYGTSPNKFFDYIASGLPVVNNYPGWLADMINEHQCGIAVAPEQPEALADALQQLADNPQKGEAMRGKAQALAKSQFDRQQLASRFIDVLEGVAS